MLLLSRREPQGGTGRSAALGVASSALAMALARSAADTNRSYYGTDTRAGAFLFGAAAAAALAGARSDRQRRAAIAPPAVPPEPVRAHRGWSAAVGLVGLALTTTLWVTLTGTSIWLFRGGLPLAALATVAMIVDIVRRPAGVLARALSNRPLRLLGRVSYGVYLWHWPLLLVINHQRTGLSGWELLTVRLAAIAVATTASWILIERPILHHFGNIGAGTYTMTATAKGFQKYTKSGIEVHVAQHLEENAALTVGSRVADRIGGGRCSAGADGNQRSQYADQR